VFELIVEQKIVAAAERGELSDLPGQGAPLRMDDDTLIPVELRMVYRILRNAGFVPPELEALRAIGCIERCIENLSEGRPRSRALRKLQFLRLRLEKSGRPQNLPRYAQKLLARLEERCVDERCFDKFDDCS
jgi:hypothetical protein